MTKEIKTYASVPLVTRLVERTDHPLFDVLVGVDGGGNNLESILGRRPSTRESGAVDCMLDLSEIVDDKCLVKWSANVGEFLLETMMEEDSNKKLVDTVGLALDLNDQSEYMGGKIKFSGLPKGLALYILDQVREVDYHELGEDFRLFLLASIAIPMGFGMYFIESEDYYRSVAGFLDRNKITGEFDRAVDLLVLLSMRGVA